MNRSKGSQFEDAALQHIQKIGLRRPSDLSAPRTDWAKEMDHILRPAGGSGVLEINIVAKGLWIDTAGNPVWVECSGVFDGSSRPGFLRSDTTRKITGTINCVMTMCLKHFIEPPRILLVTSHMPDRNSTAGAYLIWGVIRPVGSAKCRIVVPKASGMHREVPVDQSGRVH